MAEMRRSFHNVKSLLGKLDRSIDEARSRRLGDPVPQTTETAANADDGLGTVIGRAETGPEEPVERDIKSDGAPRGAGGVGTPAQAPRRSVYGRAKPLRRPEGGSPTAQWSN